jgi:hypothetical protein
MKKAQGVEDLAGRLSQAAAAPLVQPPPSVAVQNQPPKAKKASSVSVFLRLPADLHFRLEAEAVSRTKATGKGVTVQQVILDKLAGQP